MNVSVTPWHKQSKSKHFQKTRTLTSDVFLDILFRDFKSLIKEFIGS